MSRDLSEMMMARERSQRALINDAQWQAHILRHINEASLPTSDLPHHSIGEQVNSINHSDKEQSPHLGNMLSAQVEGGVSASQGGVSFAALKCEAGKLESCDANAVMASTAESSEYLLDNDETVGEGQMTNECQNPKGEEMSFLFDKQGKVGLATRSHVGRVPRNSEAVPLPNANGKPADGTQEDIDRKTPLSNERARAMNRNEKPRKAIRRHRMTKEEEARFDPVLLSDLKGTTAARSRKMSAEEHDVMLHKRRLRNRASAARSREKQRKTINELSEEVEELKDFSWSLLKRAAIAESQNLATTTQSAELAAQVVTLQAQVELLQKENASLKAASVPLQVVTQPFKALSRQSSLLQLTQNKIQLADLFDQNGQQSPRTNFLPGCDVKALQRGKLSSSSLKLPSSLSVSLSSERLDSHPFSPIPRTLSFLERFFVDNALPNALNSAHKDSN